MMNIETLLQAAQILESQQSIPPKKRLARGDRQSPPNAIPASVLASTTIHTNPAIISSPPPPTASLPKTEHLVDYPQRDLNLNVHHLNHLAQQQARSLQKQSLTTDHGDLGDDDDDDDIDPGADGNGDMPNRGQGTCFRDREIHNRLEKHRRAHLKGCFDNLKAEVPCQRDRKVTNLQILNLAIKYVQTLNRKEREYEHEIAALTSRNMELQQRLRMLKTDLNSEGHDVDTWLGSCADPDRSVSTRTASEAEMYRSFDDDDDDDGEDEMHTSSMDVKFLNGHGDLDNNNNHPGIRTHLHNSYAFDSKALLNNRKSSTRQRPRPSKRKLSSIPTTNLLQALPITIPTRSENLLDYNIARHLHLDQPCKLLTTVKDNLSSTATLTPITDIRYEIVDLFTKGTNLHLQQQQQHPQSSPLPSIASLMNRHSSPIVSPTKQTIGINTDPLTTSTTNILHQSVATS